MSVQHGWRTIALAACGVAALLGVLVATEQRTSAAGDKLFAGTLQTVGGPFDCNGGYFALFTDAAITEVHSMQVTLYALVPLVGSIDFAPPLPIGGDGSFAGSGIIPASGVSGAVTGDFEFSPLPVTVSGTFTVFITGSPSSVVCENLFEGSFLASFKTPTATSTTPTATPTATATATATAVPASTATPTVVMTSTPTPAPPLGGVASYPNVASGRPVAALVGVTVAVLLSLVAVGGATLHARRRDSPR